MKSVVRGGHGESEIDNMFKRILKSVYNTIFRKRFFEKCVVGKSTVLYEEAEIFNSLGDKKRITIGDNSHIRGQLLIFGHGGQITIGDYCYVGRNTYIWSGSRIKIGNRVLISHNCNIFDNDTHPLDPQKRHAQFRQIIETGQPKDVDLNDEDITIEDDALIGANATVLKGVTIGNGAVVAAGSVVNKDVEPFAIVAGNPAKLIRPIPPMKDNFLSWEESVQWLKKQDDKQELVKACFYDDPLIDAANRYYGSCEWKEMQERLPQTKGKVLDIGAGRGISSYAFARDGWDVTALEPDPSVVVGAGGIKQLTLESNLDIEIVQHWGEKLTFEDASFDVVYMRQALHHAHDLPAFCKEAGRVLKPGGTFIATREHVISKKEDLDSFLKNHPLHKFYGGENAFMLKEYIEAIENGGMKIIKVLKPFESNINLFPYSTKLFKIRIIKCLETIYGHLPWIFISPLQRIFDKPGRVYSFIARKL
jgi:acetyltransferase-like isoleucine patch superfamily enzyme/ubiquinone/menaquinone biosynthesis C-methylase UbiE